MTDSETKITQNQKIIGAIVIFVIFFSAILLIMRFSAPRAVMAQIKIEATTSWSGSIGSDIEGFWTVEGDGDETFNIEGIVISCAIQKETTYGYLEVSILKNGKIVKSQYTTAEYGIVSIAD